MTMSNLNRGVFTGQFAFSYIDPKRDPGRYDQKIFLATHEWEPFLTSEEEEDDSRPAAGGITPSSERAVLFRSPMKPSLWSSNRRTRTRPASNGGASTEKALTPGIRRCGCRRDNAIAW
jgi:hypothetical protein